MSNERPIEIHDEAFRDCMDPDARLELIGDSFEFTEGPVWMPREGCLIFSDIPGDTLHRWTDAGGVELFRCPSHNANGNTPDLQGNLLTCEHGSRTVTRTSAGGTVATIASTYGGRLLNSPNDIVVKSDGTIWFTDPHYGISVEQREQPANYVFRLDPGAEEPVPVADDFAMPNGLCFSPDESLLYIADTGASHREDGPRHIRTMTVSGDGKTLGGGEVFATCPVGMFDGFRVDIHGNVWTSTGEGVYCYTPEGDLIGKILTGEVVANVEFGGIKRNRLYMCCTTTLQAVYLNTRAAFRPGS